MAGESWSAIALAKSEIRGREPAVETGSLGKSHVP